VTQTANKLVDEGWLSTTNDGCYLLTPKLRTIIEAEKRRREVSPSSHDWNTFAAIVKVMGFPAGAPQAQNHAPSSTPAGRTRGRTSLVAPIVAIPARSPTGATLSSNTPAVRQTNSNVLSPNGRSTSNTRSVSSAGSSSVDIQCENVVPLSPRPSSAPRPASSAGPSRSRDAHHPRSEVPRGKKVRHSDPGPRLVLGTPIPSPSPRARRSLGSSEQPTPVPARRASGVASAARRRRPSGSNRRRHTMAVPIQPPRQQISFPAPVSQEIQFYPLKQALSARTRRALRRNALSEEMNNIDDERRAGQRRNREELAKLRAELAQSAERLRDLERELAAARYALSEEPEPMPPIREDEEPERGYAPQDEDYDMDYVPSANSPDPPATPFRGERQSADGSGRETPVSTRDKKIRDLEAMIEKLREDIKHREQEAAARAQEDEVFHDAEEQIYLEKNNFLMERIHDLEAEQSKANDMAVAFEEVEGEIDADIDRVYTGPTADDFDDDISDTEQLHDDIAFHSSAVDSAVLASSQVQVTGTRAEMDVYESESRSKKISQLEDQNEDLQRMIDDLTDRIQDMQEGARESQTELAEREEAAEALRAEVLRLKNQKQTLRMRITELEEMEGERLESMQDLMVQTDEIVDEGTVLLQERVESLNIQVSELQEMAEAVAAQKRAVDARLLEATDQISRLEAAVEAGERSKEDVNSQLQDLEKNIASLNLQINILEEERDDAQAENSRLKSEIAEHKKEIASLTSMLKDSNRERESLKQNIEELGEKVVSLEAAVQHAHGDNTGLRQDINALNAEIRTLKRASALADEEKSMIQQKIRPYIHGEQSLDMAVEEVLTELVMERNRADENERLRTELSKKIKILAQTDEEMDMESLNPEETVERLTDCFREVRGYVENLYSQCAQSEDSPFEGHELDDFAWTGSNEDALKVLRSLVGGLYQKVNEAQARTVEMEKEKEREREQCSLYGQCLSDIAITVGVEGEQLPAERDVLGLVTFRLSELRQQIESTEDKVEELQGSVRRKNDTIKSMEMDIEEAGEREASLSRELVDAIAAHETTTLQLNHAHVRIEGLNQLVQDKVTEIEDLGADLEASSEKERRLLDIIDQQASEHDTATRELQRKRAEAIARLEKLLEEEVLAKTRAEHLAAEQAREDSEVIRELDERAAGWKAQYEALNMRLDTMKADHENKVAQLKDTIAGSEGRITSLSEELREALQTSERDISALKDQLRSARDEIANQDSALSKVSAERNDVSRQLEAEILSGRDAVAGLEKRISEIKNESQLQHSRDRSRLSELKAEIETHKANSLQEQEHSRAEIHARDEAIESYKARISELEALLGEAEESEAALEEGIKSRESQLQLSYEETAKIKGALEAEKDKLVGELTELRIEMEQTRTDLTADIEGLRTILEGKEARIDDLEAVVGILRSERTKLAETVEELEAEQIRYQDMLESERQSGLEAVQALSHQAEKYMVRFGEVKQQYIRESARRQAEGKKASKRLREQDDETDNDVADVLLHAPPTPASTSRPLSVTHGAKKRESKRRKHDSGIGVEEEEEEEQYTFMMPA